MTELARSFNDVAAAYELGRPPYDDHAIAALAERIDLHRAHLADLRASLTEEVCV